MAHGFGTLFSKEESRYKLPEERREWVESADKEGLSPDKVRWSKMGIRSQEVMDQVLAEDEAASAAEEALKASTELEETKVEETTPEVSTETEEVRAEEAVPEASETETVAARDEALGQDREEMLAAARSEDIDRAQEEIEVVLAGRTIEQALKDFDAEIEKLEGEIVQMQAVMPSDGSRKYYERMILEAQGDLGSLERKRQMLENLQHGGNAVEAPEQKDLSQQAAGGELGDLNPREENDAENVESELENSRTRTVDEIIGDWDEEEIAEIKDKIQQLKEQIAQKREERDAATDAEEKAKLEGEVGALVQELNESYEGLSWKLEKPNEEMIAEITDRIQRLKEDIAGWKIMRDEAQDEETKAELGVETGVLVNSLNNAYKALWQRRQGAGLEKMTLDAGERERMRGEVYENAKNNKGFRRVVRRVRAAVATLMVTAGIMMGSGTRANSAELGHEANEEIQTPTAVTQMLDAQMESVRGGGVANEIVEAVGTVADTTEVSRAQEFLNESGVKIEDLGDIENLANYEKLDNGTFYNYDEFYGYGDMGAKVTVNSFGTDKTAIWETKDPNLVANSIYKMSHDQPEVLASTVESFPSILTKCGLPADASAEYIDAELSKGENGGELQRNLLNALKEMLEDENTQIEFSTVQGRVWTPYMVLAGDKTPVGHVLGLDQMTRENAPQILIRKVITNADGSKTVEEGYYSAECGWQRNMKIEDPEQPPEEPETAMNEEVLPEPEPEPVPIPEPEPTPPTPPTPPEPTPTPPTPPEPTPPEPTPPEPTPPTPPEPTPPEPTPPEPTPPAPTPTPDPTPKPKVPGSVNENGSLSVGDNEIDETLNIDEMPDDQIGQVGDGQIDRGDITGDQTGTYEVTEEPTIPEDNQGTKVDNAVPDADLSGDQQNQVQQAVDEAEAAADAMEEEGARPTTEGAIDAYLQQLLNNPMDNNGEMDG